MGTTFRAAMNWLHTWTGVVLGALLFAIFWTGTLSVLDREIDRWMQPMTRLALPQRTSAPDRLRPFYEAAAEAKAPTWLVVMPTEREPVFQMSWRERTGVVRRLAHPATGEELPDPGSWAGTRFLYPFHYTLHLRAGDVGYWLVGLAAMAMLAMCVSGVVIHRKLFADFFTMRPDRRSRRLLLDLHNVTGVLGLPFHLAITLSGLIVFWSFYFPWPLEIAYRGDRAAFNQESLGLFARPRLGKPADLASLDALAGAAGRLWDGGELRYLSVRQPGDEAAVVQIGHAGDDSVGDARALVVFDAVTGKLLHQRPAGRPVMAVQRFVAGLHLIQFRHWTLRWLYFALGLAGCATIATGSLFWLEARRKTHAQLGLHGVRVVEGMTIGSVGGIVIATLGFFVVNRLLPLGAAFASYDRAALEIWTFYLLWLATFAHAWLRPRLAWIEQCRAIGVLAVAAVLLNWMTTGDHLARSLAHRHLWPVAGMDLLLLAAAATAAHIIWRLKRLASRGCGRNDGF